MNITKSLLCRAGVTAAVTSAIILVFWYLTTVIPPKLPDLPWVDVFAYTATIVLIIVIGFLFVLMWKDLQWFAILLMIMIGIPFVLAGLYSTTYAGGTLERNVALLFGSAMLIELVALVVHEYVAKKVCRRILGGNHE